MLTPNFHLGIDDSIVVKVGANEVTITNRSRHVLRAGEYADVHVDFSKFKDKISIVINNDPKKKTMYMKSEYLAVLSSVRHSLFVRRMYDYTDFGFCGISDHIVKDGIIIPCDSSERSEIFIGVLRDDDIITNNAIGKTWRCECEEFVEIPYQKLRRTSSKTHDILNDIKESDSDFFCVMNVNIKNGSKMSFHGMNGDNDRFMIVNSTGDDIIAGKRFDGTASVYTPTDSNKKILFMNYGMARKQMFMFVFRDVIDLEVSGSSILKLMSIESDDGMYDGVIIMKDNTTVAVTTADGRETWKCENETFTRIYDIGGMNSLLGKLGRY